MGRGVLADGGEPPPGLRGLRPLFRDRREAGEALARALRGRVPGARIVFALPRGGIVVAAPVASALGLPLEALVTRKIGLPWNRELAVGALDPEGRVSLAGEVLSALGLGPEDLTEVIAEEREELRRRTALYRRGRPYPDLRSRGALLVDDGLATGRSARVALEFLREKGADPLYLAVPVGAPETVAELRRWAHVVALYEPPDFQAVGQFYGSFGEVSDDEVLGLLFPEG